MLPRTKCIARFIFFPWCFLKLYANVSSLEFAERDFASIFIEKSVSILLFNASVVVLDK